MSDGEEGEGDAGDINERLYADLVIVHEWVGVVGCRTGGWMIGVAQEAGNGGEGQVGKWEDQDFVHVGVF